MPVEYIDYVIDLNIYLPHDACSKFHDPSGWHCTTAGPEIEYPVLHESVATVDTPSLETVMLPLLCTFRSSHLA